MGKEKLIKQAKQSFLLHLQEILNNKDQIDEAILAENSLRSNQDGPVNLSENNEIFTNVGSFDNDKMQQNDLYIAAPDRLNGSRDTMSFGYEMTDREVLIFYSAFALAQQRCIEETYPKLNQYGAMGDPDYDDMITRVNNIKFDMATIVGPKLRLEKPLKGCSLTKQSNNSLNTLITGKFGVFWRKTVSFFWHALFILPLFSGFTLRRNIRKGGKLGFTHFSDIHGNNAETFPKRKNGKTTHHKFIEHDILDNEIEDIREHTKKVHNNLQKHKKPNSGENTSLSTPLLLDPESDSEDSQQNLN